MIRKPESLIFDLDNTLYDYDRPHQLSIQKVLQQFSRQFNLAPDDARAKFELARHQTHTSLSGYAASHNRILYFQKMLESIGANSMDHTMDLYNLYWDNFLEEMKLSDGVEALLASVRKKKIKCCILTDLTAHIQFRKITRTGISKYFDFLVTSEEVGLEKPHRSMFAKALEKLKTEKENAIMIGDHWKNDIEGAQAFGLRSIWLNQKMETREVPPGVTEVNGITAIKDIVDSWS